MQPILVAGMERCFTQAGWIEAWLLTDGGLRTGETPPCSLYDGLHFDRLVNIKGKPAVFVNGVNDVPCLWKYYRRPFDVPLATHHAGLFWRPTHAPSR